MQHLFSAALLVTFTAFQAAAESQVPPAPSGNALQLNFGAHYGPATSASLQIQAEAQYLRAYGEMQKDLAEARIRHAEARRLEGANEVQAVRDHIAKRDLIEADRDKRIGKKLADRRKVNERILERLKNHPELNSTEIVTGVALNFLKNRLSPTVVTFRSASMGSQEAILAVSSQLRLPAGTVHSLQARQNLPRGESFVFRLDEGGAIQVDWWPPALRSAELRSARTKFQDARKALAASQAADQSQEKKFDAIGKLILAHSALEEAFVQRQSGSDRFKSGNAFAAYLDGKAFLKTLGAEVRRMEQLGPGGSSTQSLSYKGDDLPELLTHMVRNGLDFAPAKPGDEPAYQQVFHMLRDLYVAVEADADLPEASTKAVIPPVPTRFPVTDPTK